jgi:hypothetical protein
MQYWTQSVYASPLSPVHSFGVDVGMGVDEGRGFGIAEAAFGAASTSAVKATMAMRRVTSQPRACDTMIWFLPDVIVARTSRRAIPRVQVEDRLNNI